MGPETDKGLFVGGLKMQIITRGKGIKEYTIRKSIFHRTAEELREFIKENNTKLLRLLEYLRRRKAKYEKQNGVEKN